MKLNILTFCCLWWIKCTSLPKLYHRITSRRDVSLVELRKLEKDGLKLTKLSLDVKYLESCRELGLCPKFLQFKTPNIRAYENTDTLYAQVLNNQINVVKNDFRQACTEFEADKKNIGDSLSLLERTLLISFLNKRFENSTRPILEKHQSKLLRLWKTSRFRSPDCLMNLSKRQLSIQEQNVLRCGLKHNILPKRVDPDSVKTNVEKVIYRAEKQTGIKVDVNFRDQIKHCLTSFLNKCKNVCGTLRNQAFHRTIYKLAKDSSIKICNFDKGTGVVILDSQDYFAKLDSIVNDTSKFEEIVIPDIDKDHPIVKNENSIIYYYDKYIKPFIDPIKGLKIRPSGSQPGKLFGFCKVHKNGNPLRPVVSMSGTAEYGLAQYLDEIIKPHVPSYSMVNSTIQFLTRLKNYVLSPTDVMVSFDVVSLFTNVPLNETIDIVADYVYASDSVHPVPKFSKNIFIKLLKKATGGMFLYKDKLYRQIDGVAMGGPLGPTLANFFLGHLETKLFMGIDFAPSLYLRYVDDIFAVFRSVSDKLAFFDRLNNQHPNLKFTLENATDCLPFLDVEVRFRNADIQTSVYRKKTHTGVFMNFNSIVPSNWKFGLIFGMINRAWSICSSQDLFKIEINKLRKMFYDNGYTTDIFNKVLQKFLRSREEPNATPENEPERLVLKVPYIGKFSVDFQKQISKIVDSKFHVKLSPVYTSCKVGDFFSLKSSTPLTLVSNVVYKFTCLLDADMTYIHVLAAGDRYSARTRFFPMLLDGIVEEDKQGYPFLFTGGR